MLLVVLWLPLCGAQTAYIIPSLQQDVPSNHSYMTLSSIVTQPDIIKQYDVIMLTTDYRVRVRHISTSKAAAWRMPCGAHHVHNHTTSCA